MSFWNIKNKNFMINSCNPDIKFFVNDKYKFMMITYQVIYTDGPLQDKEISTDIEIYKDNSITFFVKEKNPEYGKGDEFNDDNEFFAVYHKRIHPDKVLALFNSFQRKEFTEDQYLTIIVDELLIDVMDNADIYTREYLDSGINGH